MSGNFITILWSRGFRFSHSWCYCYFPWPNLVRKCDNSAQNIPYDPDSQSNNKRDLTNSEVSLKRLDLLQTSCRTLKSDRFHVFWCHPCRHRWHWGCCHDHINDNKACNDRDGIVATLCFQCVKWYRIEAKRKSQHRLALRGLWQDVTSHSTEGLGWLFLPERQEAWLDTGHYTLRWVASN